jgi:hypothetical protein
LGIRNIYFLCFISPLALWISRWSLQPVSKPNCSTIPLHRGKVWNLYWFSLVLCPGVSVTPKKKLQLDGTYLAFQMTFLKVQWPKIVQFRVILFCVPVSQCALPWAFPWVQYSSSSRFKVTLVVVFHVEWHKGLPWFLKQSSHRDSRGPVALLWYCWVSISLLIIISQRICWAFTSY